MTPEEVREAALELVERSTAASGVPRYIEDEKFLRRVAAMLDERDETPATIGRGPISASDPITRTDARTTAQVHGTERRHRVGASRGRR